MSLTHLISILIGFRIYIISVAGKEFSYDTSWNHLKFYQS